MFTQEIYLKSAKWMVVIFHEADEMWADEIIDSLIEIGCRVDKLEDASRMLWGGMLNEGITYSNISKRQTAMVIGHTTSGMEYWNSLDHEKLHLLQDISLADGINPFGEEISYISGEFIGEVYTKAKDLLCDCCRKKNIKHIIYKK